MQIHSNYRDTTDGKLYVVPTPIGNLDDMTFRAVKTLEAVELILAEDTRHTLKLLNHFQIHNKLLSYHEHNVEARLGEAIELLHAGGDLAIVSDAGMPAISDPGYKLIQNAIQEDIRVIVLPGANAALCALVGSGLPTNEFLFHGFLPRKKQSKIETLARLGKQRATVILYESPYRIKDTLIDIEKHIGNRSIVISREITKMYEQFIRGSCKELIDWAKETEVKGECCIIIGGNDGSAVLEEDVWWLPLSIWQHVGHYEQEGYTNKEAMKQTALDRNIPKREVYKAIHIDE